MQAFVYEQPSYSATEHALHLVDCSIHFSPLWYNNNERITPAVLKLSVFTK